MIKVIVKSALSIVIVLVVVTMLYNTTKAMPEGTSIEGEIHMIEDKDIDFLYDLTYINASGQKVIRQEIFKNVFDIINNSERFIIIDMFLFNTDYGGNGDLIPLTTDMKNLLIQKKRNNPRMNITFITDEINNFYGSYEAQHFVEMRDAGINVIITDLEKLRDSNPAYSSFWRVFLKPFGDGENGSMKHPLGNKEYNVTLKSWLKLLNTKANHRKVMVADKNDSIVTLITSANPHEASSLHSNVALRIDDGVWKDAIAAEKSIAAFSGGMIPEQTTEFANGNNEGDIGVQLLTEGKIKKSLLENIEGTDSQDTIDIAMFYLSDREIVEAILKASKRNVSVRLILDPNKDAFAREKNGIPNRQAAYELVEKSKGNIQIRWYDTRGEQFHTKMVIIQKDGKIILYLGSANLTRRNIGDLNIEADVRVESPISSNISQEVIAYFRKIWSNEDGSYTLNMQAYEDPSALKSAIYKFQEGSGLSSF